MKISFIPTVLSLATLLIGAVAQVDLGSFPEVVDVGKTYTLSWTAAENYTYAIWLVFTNRGDEGVSWTKIDTLGKGVHFDTLSPTFTWTVLPNVTAQDGYAIWVDGFYIPFDGSSYSEKTEWFEITFNGSSSSTSTSTSTVASSTVVASRTATATASTTPTPTVTAITSPNTGGTHHASLSAGAIAGIIIGLLIVAAIVAAAVILGRHRKKKAGIAKREAEARANRLAPVMAGADPSYEMYGRNSELAKETNV